MLVYFDHDRQIEILPLEDNFSLQWYEEVKNIYKNGIREDDRIYGFSDNWSYDMCLKDIKKQIQIINEYKKIIDYDLSNINQQILNELHVFFENIIGMDMDRNSFYLNAPINIQKAIQRFNILIHRIEGLEPGMSRPDKTKFWSKRIVVTFNDRPRYKIPDDELYRFNFLQKPGDVCLNYCHVGKPLYDIFDNDDHSVSDENILPQSHWSADFHMIFNDGLQYDPQYNVKVKQWWNQNRDKLSSLGWYENNPKNAWGMLKVARVTDYNPKYLEGIMRVEAIEF